MTEQQLATLCGSEKRAGVFTDYLNAAMGQYQINTVLRQAAFLAQVMHESLRLIYTREIASGRAYEGRADLGNTEPGDGVKFKGRGLIQITGRSNYSHCSQALFGDSRLLETPDLLASPRYAALSAAWFWSAHGLNELADARNFKAITRRINGGLNGEADREKYYAEALELLT